VILDAQMLMLGNGDFSLTKDAASAWACTIYDVAGISKFPEHLHLSTAAARAQHLCPSPSTLVASTYDGQDARMISG